MQQVEKYNGNQELLSKEDIKTLIEANIIPENTPPAMIKTFAKFCYEKNPGISIYFPYFYFNECL